MGGVGVMGVISAISVIGVIGGGYNSYNSYNSYSTYNTYNTYYSYPSLLQKNGRVPDGAQPTSNQKTIFYKKSISFSIYRSCAPAYWSFRRSMGAIAR